MDTELILSSRLLLKHSVSKGNWPCSGRQIISKCMNMKPALLDPGVEHVLVSEPENV
jgi:hypothetical protein